jgi:pimeloyl-ACP methyl ester carboxylesterase
MPFRRFHANANINYHLNRVAVAGSTTMAGELAEVVPEVRDSGELVRELMKLSTRAVGHGRFMDASLYVRAAEVFLSPATPAKRAAYERYRRLVDRTPHRFCERYGVACDGARLVATHLGVEEGESRGTIVLHGGLDTFLEELRPLLVALNRRGFEVIGFEGPGQGAVLYRQGITMSPVWGRPVAAVLDYFAVRQATLVGISLGGCLALRAAADEPRVKGVVSISGPFSLFDCMVSFSGGSRAWLARALLEVGADAWLDALAARQARKDPLAKWGLELAQHVLGADSPARLLREARRYTTADLAERITQDVLLLVGENDHLVPPSQADLHIRSLVRARSVTRRVFSAADDADHHCQVGNLALSLDTIVDWIESLQRYRHLRAV